MFSNWIVELDNNSIQFIVDEQKAEIEQRKAEIENLKESAAEKDEKLAEQSRKLTEAENENRKLLEQIARLKEKG